MTPNQNECEVDSLGLDPETLAMYKELIKTVQRDSPDEITRKRADYERHIADMVGDEPLYAVALTPLSNEKLAKLFCSLM